MNRKSFVDMNNKEYTFDIIYNNIFKLKIKN